MLLNPYALGGLALALAMSHGAVGWKSYRAGAGGVQERWDQAEAARAAALAEDSVADAEASVRVVTKYVDRERVVYRDRPVIRERIVRMCDEPNGDPVLPGGSGDSDAAPAPDPLDALAGEIPECVSIANQLDALQQFIRERW